MMIIDFLLSPLDEFARLIADYFREVWDFLIFQGIASSFLFVLVGAIMLFVGVRVGKTTGRGLILGGIILVIIIVYIT